MNEDQQIILQKINKLPPENKKKMIPDQVQHWEKTKIVSNVQHMLFEQYFSGHEIDFTFVEEPGREFCEAQFEYFLSFYNLIQWGWGDLKKALKSDGYDFLETPGQCFAQILDNVFRAQIYICEIPRYDISPRKINEITRLIRKDDLGKAQYNKLKEYTKKLSSLGFGKFSKLQIFCLAVLVKSKNKKVQEKLKEYFNRQKQLQDVEMRLNRNKRAIAWQNGHKLESVKEGGTYKTVT